MRTTSHRALARLALLALGLGGCANAGSPSGSGDDDAIPVDAAVPSDGPRVTVDAAIPVDAAPMIDAFAPLDAPSQGLFCQTNGQCTVGGECCVTLGGPNGFCAPGTVVLGQCVPG